MALADGNGNGMVMPVSPMYGGGYGNGMGMGMGGDWFAWLILLLLIGNNGWGNGNGMNGGNGGGLYPWLNQSENTFTGFQNLSTQLCNGFSEIQQSIMNSQFNTQQGFNQVGTQLCNGFGNIQNGIADLKYTIATENCQDRAQAYQNTRDIIDNQNRGNQAIIDKLCQLELDGVKEQLAQSQRENVGLQNQLNMANLAASQIAQDQRIVDSIYNRLSTCPVGTTPVYGSTPIFTCPQNQNNCGCGCGNF